VTLDVAIYEGDVVHRRLRPVQHALSYRVFSLLIDVDRLKETAAKLRLFSYNKANAISLHDRDFGAGDGVSIAEQARRIFEAAGFETAGARILLLAYPRVFGYAFNPLSVYFLVGGDDRLIALNYEVSNTFSERKGYVVSAGCETAEGIYAQGCRKELFVSPFAAQSGTYHFRVRHTDDRLTVGVAYADADGPLIKTYFHGRARPLGDRLLGALLIRLPLMTLKVIGAIHYEALKLWLKGVPLVEGHSSPRFSVSYFRDVRRRARRTSEF
jgi:uncharacterized protein